MGNSVVITEAAWADMFAIGQAIAANSPRRARTFVDELYDRCYELREMAHAFPLLPGHNESAFAGACTVTISSSTG